MDLGRSQEELSSDFVEDLLYFFGSGTDTEYMATLTTTKTQTRPKFSGGCALKIRTYDIVYRDGARGIIRADVSVVARMISHERENVKEIKVRGY